jgi:dynein heavy chain
VFRPEKLAFAFTDYVKDEIGQMYVEDQTITMKSIFADSDCKTPVIFILSQGADPTTALYKFAREMEFDSKLTGISLGQGQGVKAEKLISEAKVTGEWILLQNCHLAKSWMTSLELIVQNLQEENIHTDFRLFLTSMPANYFPISVLQNGVKLTTEPPRGIRANMMKSYTAMTQEFLETNKKPEQWQKLLFGLCFFHATIQERRKFGPLGWNIRYEFNDSDLETSQTNLSMFLNEQDDIPWDALTYVTGHINYGGRVTDDWDRVCLLSILKKFYTEDIFEQGYQFSQSGIYHVPKQENSLEAIKEYIQSMPLNDSPEVFGLHENANITYQTQESEKMVSTILSIQPRVAGGSGGKSTDEIVSELSQELEGKLPSQLDLGNCLKGLFKTNEKGLMQSLSTVLVQEIERFNRLLKVMADTLVELQKAIKGLVVMSSELDKMYVSFSNGQVPANWQFVAYPSLKPLMSWFRDLIERVAFMTKWLTGGHPNAYWISGFFFPQGFMTGVLQTYARKHTVAIDQLNFGFKILDCDEDGITLAPNDGVYVYGLFMDGARWDRDSRVIDDQYPGEMYSSMPVILFKPTAEYKQDPEEYQCPVYKTSVRAGVLSTTGQSTNFILPVDVPSVEAPSYWTLKGAALLCQLNE